MNTKTLFLLGSLVALLVACNPKTANWKIKTAYHINKLKIEDSVYTSDGATCTNIYSDEGRLTACNLSNGNRQQFTSGKSGDTTTTFNSNGEQVGTDVWLKSDKGQVDSVVNYNDEGASQKFVYDADGNKIEVRMYKLGGVLHMVERKKFSNGLNVSSEIAVVGSTDTIFMLNPVTMKNDTLVRKTIGDTSTYYYTYYPNKETTPAYIKYLKEHWGDGSVQLKKTSTQINHNGDTLGSSNYRYTFDELNRVTSIVIESNTHTEYDSTAYTYY